MRSDFDNIDGDDARDGIGAGVSSTDETVGRDVSGSGGDVEGVKTVGGGGEIDFEAEDEATRRRSAAARAASRGFNVASSTTDIGDGVGSVEGVTAAGDGTAEGGGGRVEAEVEATEDDVLEIASARLFGACSFFLATELLPNPTVIVAPALVAVPTLLNDPPNAKFA